MTEPPPLRELRRLNDYFAWWPASDRSRIPVLNSAAMMSRYVSVNYGARFHISVAVALYDFFQTEVPSSLRSSGTQKAIADFYSCYQSTVSDHYRRLLEERQHLDSDEPDWSDTFSLVSPETTEPDTEVTPMLQKVTGHPSSSKHGNCGATGAAKSHES